LYVPKYIFTTRKIFLKMRLLRTFTTGFALVVSGLTLSASGIGYALLAGLNRYSGPVDVLSVAVALFSGIALVMLGLGIFTRQKPFYLSVSGLAYVLGISWFVYLYPSLWRYPEAAYAVLLYAFATYLLLYGIIIRAGSHMLDTCTGKSESGSSLSAALAHFVLLANGSVKNYPESASIYPEPEIEDETTVVPESAEIPSEDESEKNTAVDISTHAAAMGEPSEPSGEGPVNPDMSEKREKDTTGIKADPLKMTVSVEDSMAGAARKVLNNHFRIMQEHEHGTKVGRDIEELHDMRVAAMRIKAAFDIFAPYLNMKKMTPHLKNVRRTRRKLGYVRDMDVFLQNLGSYCGQLPDEGREGLRDMMDAIEIERAKKRGEMLVYLDGENYGRFKKRFNKALGKDDLWDMDTLGTDGNPLPHRVRDTLPVLVYGQFSALLAYDEFVSGDPHEIPVELLHRLRIDVKIMRYTLEFFRDVLEKDAKPLIRNLKDLQDNLGDMHDASVAVELLQGYEETGRWGAKEADPAGLEDAVASSEAITSLVIAKHEEIAGQRALFPEKWNAVKGTGFGGNLASAIAGLYR
jgi:CHAD domain-containing protein